MQRMYSDLHIMLLLRNPSHFEFWNILDFLVFQSSLSIYKSCKNVSFCEEWARTLSLSSMEKRRLRRRWPHCSLQLPEGDMRRGVLRKSGKILFFYYVTASKLRHNFASVASWLISSQILSRGWKTLSQVSIFKNSRTPYTHIRTGQ